MISSCHKIKIHFNLSHTYSYAAIIINNVSKCGIDIEEDKGIVLDEGLIN
jgi:phosphopantetheinyl transferase